MNTTSCGLNTQTFEDGFESVGWLDEDKCYESISVGEAQVKARQREEVRFVHQTAIQSVRQKAFDHLRSIAERMRAEGVHIIDITANVWQLPIYSSVGIYVRDPALISTGNEGLDLVLRSVIPYMADHLGQAKSTVNYSDVYIRVGRYQARYHHRGNCLRALSIEIDWDAPNSDLLEEV